MELNVVASQDWLYQVALRLYAAVPIIGLVLTKVDAPHGRFNSKGRKSTSRDSNSKTTIPTRLSLSNPKWDVNGTWAWIVMELPSPIAMLYAYSKTPLATTGSTIKSNWTSGPNILAALYLAHYLNRAIISPLRTHARSPSHIIVPIFAILFNLLNGSLMGAYLSRLAVAMSQSSTDHAMSGMFWGGLTIFFLGFVSNVMHDKILLRLRKPSDGTKSEAKYSIPYGGLYRFVSYPNYLSEWVEWTGFAIAATSLHAAATPYHALGLRSTGVYTPPWLFVAAEIAVMLPRALSGHAWYQQKFDGRYPKERKAIIPYLL